MTIARTKYLCLALLAFVGLAGSATYAFADEAESKEAAQAAAEKKEKPEFPPFDKIVEGMETKEGLITLYHDKEKDLLLAGISPGMLEKNFLLATSVAGGGAQTGWQWNDGVFYFRRHDRQLVLMEADPRYSRGANAEVADVIQRTYTDSIVTAIPIVTVAPNGAAVISLDNLLKSDISGAARGVNPMLSRWVKIKPFEQNVELEADLASQGSYTRVHYSISALPKTNYSPRAADDRVGYFLTVQKDWTVPHSADTTFKRYINRWALEKAVPGDEVSDVTADSQIIFYIEKTVPVKYRRYVREGILEWNKAFEKAGLRNAIQVRQQTDNTFADLDPEDVRYNFFRWIVSGRAYAMGPSRANPYTGQIYDADIVFDDAMLRSIEQDWEMNEPRAFSLFSDPRLHKMMAETGWADVVPEPPMPDSFKAILQDGQANDLFAESQEQPSPFGAFRQHDHSQCEMGRGMAQEIAMGRLVARAAADPNLAEKFIGQAIKETVMHEVGHTLGLRHNFKASSWKSLDEIRAASSNDEATVASVMDYNPYIFATEAEEQGNFTTPTLGPYDYWAIEYGYRVPGKEDKSEDDMLTTIAARSTEDGLAFATDEDSGWLEPDPNTLPWDMGDDPIKFAEYRLELGDNLLKNIQEWAVKDGKSYSKLRDAFERVLFQRSYGAYMSCRLVGGIGMSRDHKSEGNAGTPLTPVSAEQQRKALKFVQENILAADAFEFDPELIKQLAPARWMHWDSDEYDSQLEYPVHDRVLAIQANVLMFLMNPAAIDRLYDCQVMAEGDDRSIGIPELFQSLTEAIWSELDGGEVESIPSYRRNLQRLYLDRLVDAIVSPGYGGYRPDVNSVVRQELMSLKSKLESAKEAGGEPDAYTRAHLSAALRKIDAALDASYLID